jgi:hypothetical protein
MVDDSVRVFCVSYAIPLLQTTKSLYRLLRTDPCCQFLCKLISRQYGVYIPRVLSDNETWKSRLRDVYALRLLWSQRSSFAHGSGFSGNSNDPANANQGEILRGNMKKFKIKVYAKFRPLVHENEESNRSFKALMSPHSNSQEVIQTQSIDEVNYSSNKEDSLQESIEVTLPLHQRLSMIKMSHNIKSNRQALKILASEGGWFAAKWNVLAMNNQKQSTRNELSLLDIENRNESNIHYNPVMTGKKAEKLVAKGKKRRYQTLTMILSALSIIYYPFLKGCWALILYSFSLVQTIDPLKGRVVVVAPDVGLREFSYDGVFAPSSTQEMTYDKTTHNLVCDLLNGSNATVLVYGQTSSGKTYTMFGPDNINYEIFSTYENIRLEEMVGFWMYVQ